MKLHTILAPLLLALARAHADDESDFSAAPPASWQRANPIGLATFSFTGGVATISANPPPPAQVPTIGLARGAVFGSTEYTDSAVSADVVAWSTQRVFASVITRVGTPAGLGTSCGYSLTLIPSTGAVELHRLTGEIPTLLTSTQFIAMTPGATYRLVLVSVGITHTCRVYDTANLTVPLLQFSAEDSTYASGRSGIVASTDSYNSITASFDNFLAWPGTAAPLKVLPADSLPGYIVLESDARRSLASYWESTDDLTFPWSPATPFGASVSAPTVSWSFAQIEPQRFFPNARAGDELAETVALFVRDNRASTVANSRT